MLQAGRQHGDTLLLQLHTLSSCLIEGYHISDQIRIKIMGASSVFKGPSRPPVSGAKMEEKIHSTEISFRKAKYYKKAFLYKKSLESLKKSFNILPPPLRKK